MPSLRGDLKYGDQPRVNTGSSKAGDVDHVARNTWISRADVRIIRRLISSEAAPLSAGRLVPTGYFMRAPTQSRRRLLRAVTAAQHVLSRAGHSNKPPALAPKDRKK